MRTERRIALVIGNAQYKEVPLRNAANDARDIAAALRGTGFEVTMVIDAGLTRMKKSIRDFGDRIRGGGVGLFFYAGHGLQVEGENYLVPVGAEVKREYEVDGECLKVTTILGAMESARNRLNIVILDACRDNPFRGFRGLGRGLARMDAPAGSILAYATAPGSVASDGPQRNGLYTSKLLKHLRTPGLEIGRLFRLVRTEVMSASRHAQVPWESVSLTGEFYFVP